MHISRYREGGAYEIETWQTMAWDALTESHDVATCFVVYADWGQPSHSVRVFAWSEE